MPPILWGIAKNAPTPLSMGRGGFMRYGRGMRGSMLTRRLVTSPLCADMGRRWSVRAAGFFTPSGG